MCWSLIHRRGEEVDEGKETHAYVCRVTGQGDEVMKHLACHLKVFTLR